MTSDSSDGRTTLPEEQLHESCRILFGQEAHITRQFLSGLQPSDVKIVYRRLAMETHPDRACHLGVDEAILVERFRDVHCAYKQVYAYVEEPDRYVLTVPPKPARRHRRPVTKPSAPQQAHFYKGTIPCRRVFIGQYLYYSGIISMRQMWDAVVWQQIHRPRLGTIAREFGWLSPADIQSILRHRSREELFGEFAVRTELLSARQVHALLDHQRSFQLRIGVYLTDRGILSPKKLDAIEAALKEHNRKHWFKKG